MVGVGDSAGGLETLTELLNGISPRPGLAFLIAVHLDPHHKSHLPEILGKTTAMPVREVTEGMAVHANEVYLLPPNTNMALTDGHLMLTPRSPTPGSHMPIDHLFRSLAAVQGVRAIGIVLSGGGTDGALGMQAIKAEGGISFAQDEKSARHPSMPRAAIQDGTIDYVLRPSEIARELDASPIIPIPAKLSRTLKCNRSIAFWPCCTAVWPSISRTTNRAPSNAVSSAAWLCTAWRTFAPISVFSATIWPSCKTSTRIFSFASRSSFAIPKRSRCSKTRYFRH